MTNVNDLVQYWPVGVVLVMVGAYFVFRGSSSTPETKTPVPVKEPVKVPVKEPVKEPEKKDDTLKAEVVQSPKPVMSEEQKAIAVAAHPLKVVADVVDKEMMGHIQTAQDHTLQSQDHSRVAAHLSKALDTIKEKIKKDVEANG